MSTAAPTAAPVALEPDDIVLPEGARAVDNEPDTSALPPTEAPTASNGNGKHARLVTAWHDHEAELHLAANLMVGREHIADALAIVQPDDLSPRGAGLLLAIIDLDAAGERFDAGSVARHRAVDNLELVKALDTHVTGTWRPYAVHLAALAHRRRIYQAAEELQQAARTGDDERIERWRGVLSAVHGARAPVRPAIDIDDLLDEPDADYDWLIPGLLERQDRLILTAGEGDGKSTLLRQIGLRAGAGQHPFTGEPIDPIRTLIVDCENSRNQVRRAIRTIRDAAEGYQPGGLRIECRPDSIDLLDRADVAWLSQLVDASQPDLLIIGPLYKMIGGDPIKEEPAREASGVIDDLRARTGVTLIIEAHTPYADNPRSKRPTRPYGASLWSRWPEFGICLTKSSALEHWRGPRDEREWPSGLERSQPWPWSPRAAVEGEDAGWHGPTECAAAIGALLDDVPGEELTITTLVARLKARGGGRGYRDQTVRAAAEMLVTDARAISRPGPRGSRLYQTATAPQAVLDDDVF